jgi:hypothetical protein
MDYEEPEAPPPDPEAAWVLDNNIDPLVNVVTFGWTEGTDTYTPVVTFCETMLTTLFCL